MAVSGKTPFKSSGEGIGLKNKLVWLADALRLNKPLKIYNIGELQLHKVIELESFKFHLHG